MDESSAFAFSLLSSWTERSQSKMPPQQAYGLLDFVDDRFDFGTHAATPLLMSLKGTALPLREAARRCKAAGTQWAWRQNSPPAPDTMARSVSTEIGAGPPPAIWSMPITS